MAPPIPLEGHLYAITATRSIEGYSDTEWRIRCIDLEEAERLLPIKQAELPELFDWKIVEL